ncbi:MAG: hypothetical protein ACXU9D_21920 [Xanthobacteraceae bacterium]
MKRKEEKFLKKGLDTPLAKQPAGQISWLSTPLVVVSEQER